MGECPVCGSEIELEDEVRENEIIDCETCGAELEVITLDKSPPVHDSMQIILFFLSLRFSTKSIVLSLSFCK